MTIRQAIALVDEKKHNVYSREEKLRWLSEQEIEAQAALPTAFRLFWEER